MKTLLSILLLSIFIFSKAQLPSFAEAKEIIQTLVYEKPLTNPRKLDYVAQRSLMVKSFFYKKDMKWKYSHNPSRVKPYRLILFNGKTATALQAFDFKQAIERELFHESQGTASQMTVSKAKVILQNAIVREVEQGEDENYVIIVFKTDLSGEKSRGYLPYKNMIFRATYSKANERINRIDFETKTTFSMPEEEKLKITSANGYLSLKTKGNRTYLDKVEFNGHVRYKVISFKVNFSENILSVNN